MKAIKGFILSPCRAWKRVVAIFGVGLIYVLPILTIPGVAAIYMKVDGIKGEVTATGYEGWIELGSAAFGVGRTISTSTGSGANRDASLPTFSDVAVIKIADITTPLLFFESVLGSGRQVDIHFTTAIEGQHKTYYAITLSDVLVSSFSQSSGGDRPTESLSLNFTKIKTSYIPLDSKGTPGTPIERGYDLSVGKAF